MSMFLEPEEKRKVALLILIGWFMPFLSVLGAMAFPPAGEEDQGLYTKDLVQTGGKNDRNLTADITVKQGRGDTDREKRSGPQDQDGRSMADNTSQPNRNTRVSQEDAYGATNRGESGRYNTKTNENTHTYTSTSTYTNNTARRNTRPHTENNSSNTNPGSTQSSTQRANLNLLARVIHAEARGEPLEGQVAVGAVLLNRLESPRFPNNLWGIIFKKGEFCTVRDGQVWMNPNSQAYKAARLALAGWDPTHGALYFYNPAKTTSKWIWSRPVTTRIGSHIFAR